MRTNKRQQCFHLLFIDVFLWTTAAINPQEYIYALLQIPKTRVTHERA